MKFFKIYQIYCYIKKKQHVEQCANKYICVFIFLYIRWVSQQLRHHGWVTFHFHIYKYLKGWIHTKLLMVLIVNDDASRKRLGNWCVSVKWKCSRLLSLPGSRGTLFPNLPRRCDLTSEDVGKECVTSGLRQLNVSVNVHPLLPSSQPFSHLNSWDQRTLRWWRCWWKQLGSESLLKENSIPTWSDLHWNMRET